MFSLNLETASSVEWKIQGSQISKMERGNTEGRFGWGGRVVLCVNWLRGGKSSSAYLDTQRTVYLGGKREWGGQPTRPVSAQLWRQGQPRLFLDKSSHCSLSFSTCSFLFRPKWKALRRSLSLCLCVYNLSLSGGKQLSAVTVSTQFKNLCCWFNQG